MYACMDVCMYVYVCVDIDELFWDLDNAHGK